MFISASVCADTMIKQTQCSTPSGSNKNRNSLSGEVFLPNLTLFLFIYARSQSNNPLLRARLQKGGPSSNITAAKMDGARAVAVVTRSWPFARKIHNDLPSAAVLRVAGTLATPGHPKTCTRTHTRTRVAHRRKSTELQK